MSVFLLDGRKKHVSLNELVGCVVLWDRNSLTPVWIPYGCLSDDCWVYTLWVPNGATKRWCTNKTPFLLNNSTEDSYFFWLMLCLAVIPPCHYETKARLAQSEVLCSVLYQYNSSYSGVLSNVWFGCLTLENVRACFSSDKTLKLLFVYILCTSVCIRNSFTAVNPAGAFPALSNNPNVSLSLNLASAVVL